MKPTLRHLIVVALLLAVSGALSACVVEPGRGGGGGWCYWHHECR